jgi:hypothetical protein
MHRLWRQWGGWPLPELLKRGEVGLNFGLLKFRGELSPHGLHRGPMLTKIKKIVNALLDEAFGVKDRCVHRENAKTCPKCHALKFTPFGGNPPV